MASDKRHVILEFAKDHPHIPELQFINKDPEGIVIKEIGDNGIVNYIFRVQSADGGNSVILKYGETVPKVSGEGEVSLIRQMREYEGLQLLQSVLPDNGVKPYCLDTKHNIVAMEDLSDMQLLGSHLKAGVFNANIANKLGRILAVLHKMTLKERVSNEEWQAWESYFGTDDAITETFGYLSSMFQEDNPHNKFSDRTKPVFSQVVQDIVHHRLLEKVEKLYSSKECFIHADCHCNAVFIKDENVKLFDLEFVILGPSAQNLGYLVMSYVLWLHEALQNPDVNRSKLVKEAAVAYRNIVESYLEERDDLKFDDKKRFIGEVAILSGSTVFLFANLAALENFLTLTDDDRIHLMKLGTNLMIQHENISTVDQLVHTTFPEMDN